MAIQGKKINELTQLNTVTNETVLPVVYVDGQTTAETAQKITVSQVSSKVQSDLSSTLATKQDVLTAGNGIDISNNSTISAQQDIEDLVASSGTIALDTNKVYKISLDGNTTFSLPVTLDNTVFNQILLQLQITGTITIDWGTTHYFIDELELGAGVYDIVYEYNSLENVWYVGTISSISPNTITYFCSPGLAIQELTIGASGTQYTMPYNGIVHFYSAFSPNYWGGIYIHVYKNGSVLYTISAENNGNANTIWYPLSKGTTFALNYGGATHSMKAWLVKLNGASGN